MIEQYSGNYMDKFIKKINVVKNFPPKVKIPTPINLVEKNLFLRKSRTPPIKEIFHTLYIYN